MPPRQQYEEHSPSSLDEPLLLNDDDEQCSPTLIQEEQANSVNPREQPLLSRNVPLTLAYTGFVFAGRSVWSQSVLSTFVFLLQNEDYRAVGFITAVMGIAQLITSFPAGYLADRYRRDTLLRVASVVGVAAILATWYAVWKNDYQSLVVGLAVWGSYWGISNTSMSAIFADSIPTGKRSHYFTQRSLLVNAGYSIGPIVSLILFAFLGDTWTIRDCAIVLAVGQFICFPAIVILCFLSDDYVVPHAQYGTSSVSDNNTTNDDAFSQHRLLTTDPSLPHGDVEGSSASTAPRRDLFCACIPRRRKIATQVATADLMSGLASGMSIRYFPIFFVQNLDLSPVLVQVLYASTPLFLASCMKLAQFLSTRFGRCHVSVAFKCIGVALMWILVAVYKMENQPRWLVCSIYILRTAFINSTGALTRSVLMDNVPAAERGRWAALESLNMFSWSGSAAIGGILVGYIGLIPLFCATAGIQLLATIPLIALFGVDRLEEGGDVDHISRANTSGTSPRFSSLREPLLSLEDPEDVDEN